MSVQAHIDQLQRKHTGLEEQLAELMASPSASDAERLKVKRDKLKLKDEITRLQTTADA